jgi:hypothetical protein
MKIARTIDGGVRLEIEDAKDWYLLDCIPADAASATGLGERLASSLATDLAGEWREWVVPDLQQGFDDEVAAVERKTREAKESAGGGPGVVWIRSGEIPVWYAALNQARLAIEETHRLGSAEQADPARFPREKLGAFLRSQFYCAIQSVLLDLMSP